MVLLIRSFSLTSRLMDPIKALGKTGMLGNFLNKFDGGVEVLDDLDDHWTAKCHKHERRIVIEDLQDLAADQSVRVTILRYVLTCWLRAWANNHFPVRLLILS